MNILYRIVRKLYRLLEPKQASKKESLMSKYANVSPKAINRGASIRLDNPRVGKTYLTVGDDTIFAGTYIFESKEGYVTIGRHTHIGDSMFISRSGIEIGDNVTIAWDCTFYDHDSHSLNLEERRKDITRELEDFRLGRSDCYSKEWSVVKTAPIKICNDAWIGMGVLILKGVTIGEDCVVAARSTVTRSTPPFASCWQSSKSGKNVKMMLVKVA